MMLLSPLLLPAGKPLLQTLPPPQPAQLQINADQIAAHVSPTLYGLMTEEINHSYDGGLYAELIQNRAFQGRPTEPRPLVTRAGRRRDRSDGAGHQ